MEDRRGGGVPDKASLQRLRQGPASSLRGALGGQAAAQQSGAETAPSQLGGRSAMLVQGPGQPGVGDSCCTPRTPEGVRS